MNGYLAKCDDHKVKKDSGNAKWDKVKGLLSVAIPIDMKIKYYSKPEEAFVDSGR